tara:strand:+ start:2087 stop:2614 length:528 start_codon:yes stop_codon:yes gene_type:complete
MGTIGKDFNYKLVKNFISKEEINLLKIYTEIKHRSNLHDFDTGVNIAPTGFYADTITECLMFRYKNKIEKIIGKKLLPTYSFWRMYTYNACLHKHKDRKACEISVTINILNDGTKWPIFMDNKPFILNSGDAVIYLGCEVEHWREKFKGDYNAQVFLHYVDELGKSAECSLDNKR